jgi:hypothetical protein
VPAHSLSDLIALPCFPPVPEALMRIPEIGEQVWVEFEGGDETLPIWTGVMAAPSMPRDLDLSVEGNIKLSGIMVELDAAADLTTRASQIKASAGTHEVDAGMSRYSGVLKADTLITNSVISPSYTPGAGNIW